MSQEYLINEKVSDYIRHQSLRDSQLLARLREETSSHPRHFMQISPEQGQFLSVLVKAIGGKKTLEIGVFTGYSSLSVALALPPDGRIIACDVDEELTRVARRYWEEAGVSQKIDLRIGPGVETLDRLIAEGHAGTFDFAFIDADKTSYNRYYDQCLRLVRPGGTIALDNMLQHERVLDESSRDANAQAIHELNQRIHRDERVDAVLLALADGITLIVKRR